jgi:hypothetical protein
LFERGLSPIALEIEMFEALFEGTLNVFSESVDYFRPYVESRPLEMLGMVIMVFFPWHFILPKGMRGIPEFNEFKASLKSDDLFYFGGNTNADAVVTGSKYEELFMQLFYIVTITFTFMMMVYAAVVSFCVGVLAVIKLCGLQLPL